jgi:tetraacyldisaccharide 4'-kinase
LLYRAAVAGRNALYDRRWLRQRRLPCAVISVGNLTVGGTGKTPLVSFLAGFLREAGYRTGVVSRGYRRRSGRAPLLVADHRAILADPAAAGDEPFLIARDNPGVPVAVGADRIAAARLLLAACAAEVLILDDGFQHRRLHRDLDLLLVDGDDPWGNGRMLPRGPLREPVDSMRRAAAVVVTRSTGRVPGPLRAAIDRHCPGAVILHCGSRADAFVPADGESVAPVALRGFRAFGFSGIARPGRFEEDLQAAGLVLAGALRFPDHHPFGEADLARIAREARGRGAEVLVTTEKDLVRIGGRKPDGLPLYALRLRLEFPGRPALPDFVLDRLGARHAARDAGGA